MNIVWILATFVPALIILVFVHELGHFLAARLFGMRVDKFSVGFPPDIAKKKIGQTEYVLGLTPLGGYCKIAGMIDESMDTEFAEQEPKPDEFRAKPLWQRMVVICAGVAFNIMLAGVIFMTLKMVYGENRWAFTEDGAVFVADSSVAAQIGLQTGDRLTAIGGRPFEPSDIGDQMRPLLADDLTITVERDGEELAFAGPDNIMTRIQEAPASGGLYGLGLYNWPSVLGGILLGSPANRAGLRPGDRIVEVDGQPIVFWQEMTRLVRQSEGDSLQFTYVRGDPGLSATIWITPQAVDSGLYRIGVNPAHSTRQVPLGEAVIDGIVATWDNTVVIVTSLSRMISGRESVRENLGGPVMVARVIGEAARYGARYFWNIVGVLSITLAIINILPIPVLDGGHLAFLIYEGIMRREPSIKFRMVMQQVGLVLILALMVFLIGNDIWRAVTG